MNLDKDFLLFLRDLEYDEELSEYQSIRLNFLFQDKYFRKFYEFMSKRIEDKDFKIKFLNEILVKHNISYAKEVREKIDEYE